MRSHFFCILILNILALTSSAQVYQNETVYGRRVNRILVDSTLRIPKGLTTKTNSSIVDSAGLVALKDTTDGVYYFTGERWKPMGGSGSGGVDSFYYRIRLVDSSYYVIDRSDGISDTINFAAAAAGGDTTIFETVLDSTGQPNYRWLYAKNQKIASSAYFLVDDVNNKLMINHNNISAGGPNTKLFVKGNTIITGSIRNDFAYLNQVTDSVDWKPVVQDNNGIFQRFSYWPGGGGTSGVYETITATASQTVFNFTLVPTSTAKYTIYINGSSVPKTYYSPSGNTITFTTGLTVGDVVMIQGIQ